MHMLLLNMQHCGYYSYVYSMVYIMEPYDQKLKVKEEHLTSEDVLMMHDIDEKFPPEFDSIPLSVLDSQSTSNQRVLVKDIDGPSSVISPNLRLEEEVCLEKCEGEYMFTASTCISHEHNQHHYRQHHILVVFLVWVIIQY